MMRLCTLAVLFILVFTARAQERYILTSDSVSLYVNVKGKGQPCLYIHGGPGAGSYWLEKLYGDQLEQHFQMIYLDQRGVGRSSSPKDHNFAITRVAKDFEEVRQALGIKQWLTLGHSFGGVLQMDYAERYQQSIQGLLMINCTLSLHDSFRESWIPKAYEFAGVKNPMPATGDTVAVVKRLMDAIGILRQKELIWKMAFASPDNAKTLDATYTEIPNWNGDFSAAALGINDYWNDYRKSTARIKLPVLFFYGTNDWSIGPQHYKGVHFPNRIMYESRVGHMPFLENKTDLEKAIRSFKAKYKFS